MPSRFLAAALTAVLVVMGAGACGDGTGPDGIGDVTVTVTPLQVSAPALSAGPNGALITCDVVVRATAAGSGRAQWRGLWVRWFFGIDRSVALDSAFIGPTDAGFSWGAGDIGPADTLQSTWRVTATLPFDATFEYRYRLDDDTERLTSLRFTCGPAVPTAPNPPVITSLVVTPASGPIEPGDALTVEYTATSDLGLWQTAVILTGPCDVFQVFDDQLLLATTRVARFTVPATCPLGGGVTVAVLALDALLLQGQQVLTSGLTVVDLTPPSVGPVVLAGPYFVGDSVGLVSAFDNHRLGAIVWEVLPSGFRDSILVGASGAVPAPYARIEPQWVAATGVRVFARDVAGLESPVVESSPNAFQVYPTVTRSVRTAALAGDVRDVRFDDKRGRVYVLQVNQGRIAVLDTATMLVTQTLNVPALAFDLTPGGDSLVVALSGGIGVIDLRQPTLSVAGVPFTGLDTALHQSPLQLRVLGNGKAFVTLWGTGLSAFTLHEVDLRSGGQHTRTDAGNGGIVDAPSIERSHDGSTLVIAGSFGLQRYDTIADAFGSIHSIAGGFIWPSISTAADRVLLGVHVYDQTLTLAGQVERPFVGSGIPVSAISPDGGIVYLQWSGGIARARSGDGALLDRSLLSAYGDALRVSRDGGTLVVSGGPGTVSLMDLR